LSNELQDARSKLTETKTENQEFEDQLKLLQAEIQTTVNPREQSPGSVCSMIIDSFKFLASEKKKEEQVAAELRSFLENSERKLADFSK
jgi:hypothetical protein